MSSELSRQILGWLVMAPHLIETCNLSTDDFPSGRYRQIFEIVNELWENEQPEEIPLALLSERLGGDGAATFTAALLDGLQKPTAENFARIVRVMKRRHLSARIVVCAESLGRGHLKTGTLDDGGFAELRKLILEQDGLGKNEKPGSGAVLRRLSEIEPRPVEWTWPNRIPRGKLSLIVGDPGLGKSFLCIDLAARISNGREWPDSNGHADQGSVLLLTGEDGLADTVRVRADSAGADVSRIIVLEGVRINGESRLFSLDEHLNILENVVKENADLVLIIVDPISSFLGDLDSHKNAEIRGALAPLSMFAERSNVSIIGVSHLNKSATTDKAVYRVSGSLSFVAAARACWGVMKDPDDPEQERRLFVPVKTNLSIKPTSLIFRISDGRLEYESKGVQLDADELMNARTEDREEQNFADSWLQDFLQGGPQEVKEIRREALKDGVSKSALYRAAKRLRLGRSASGFGKFRSSTWELKK